MRVHGAIELLLAGELLCTLLINCNVNQVAETKKGSLLGRSRARRELD